MSSSDVPVLLLNQPVARQRVHRLMQAVELPKKKNRLGTSIESDHLF